VNAENLNNEDLWIKKYYASIEYENLCKKIIVCKLTYKYIGICNWVSKQKLNYSNKCKRKLTEKEINFLMKIKSFSEWIEKYNSEYDPVWLEKYNLCVEYEQKYNKSVTNRLKYKEVMIGAWYNTQKLRYKGNSKDENFKLQEDILNLLLKLDSFKKWINKGNFTNNDKWMNNYNNCLEYEDLHKNIVNIVSYKGLSI